jgi:hypothetical protein
LFTVFRECTSKIGTCSDSKDLLVQGVGTIEIKIESINRPPVILTLREVAYAPNSRCNLLSIPTLIRRANMSTYMDKAGIILYDSEKNDIAFAPIQQGLFMIKVSNASTNTAQAVAAAAVDFDDPV